MPPLGLPEGSGRLLLALGVVGTLCYLSIAVLTLGFEVKVDHPLVLWLMNTGSIIIGFYFGVRSQQKPKAPETP